MPTVIACGTSSLSGEIPQQSRHVNVLRTCHAVTLATSTMTCQMGGDNINISVLLQVGHNHIEATFSPFLFFLKGNVRLPMSGFMAE